MKDLTDIATLEFSDIAASVESTRRGQAAHSYFPKHYHAGEEEYVIESNLPDDPTQALREIPTFFRTVLLGT